MDWIQILFVTYISAGAGSGFVHSRSSHSQGSAGTGFGGMTEMHDPAHFWIYTLHIGFGNLIYADSNPESRCRKRHKFRTSISHPQKEIRMLRSSSCSLDMKCSQLWLCLNFCHQANVSQHVSVRSIVLPRTKGFTGHYLICGVVPAPTCCAVKQLDRDRRNSRLVSSPPSEITTRTGLTGELGGDSGWDGEGTMKCSKSGRPKWALRIV